MSLSKKIQAKELKRRRLFFVAPFFEAKLVSKAVCYRRRPSKEEVIKHLKHPNKDNTSILGCDFVGIWSIVLSCHCDVCDAHFMSDS